MHVAKVGFVCHNQKTARTECGKTVAVANIAIDTDADCPACRAAMEAHIRGNEAILQHAKAVGLPSTEIETSLTQWRALMYRTPRFL